VVHAVLTGLAFVIMNALHVKLGFGFSAGLFDYVLNYNKATRPWMLLPVGLVYFALYYGLFRLVIVRLNLKTPGREDEAPAAQAAADDQPPADRALAYIRALGGAANIEALDACTTRLRLTIADVSRVDTEALKRLGARGFVKPSANALQVVIGTHADQVAGEMKAALRAPGATVAALPGTFGALLSALGGRSNIRAVETASTRLRINIEDTSRVDQRAVMAAGMRGITVVAPNWIHLIVGPDVQSVGLGLRQLLI
jgi:PTS system N-acetylglucosamine-specific IIC component